MTTNFKDAADSTLHALSGFAHDARERFDDLPLPHLSVPHLNMSRLTMPQVTMPHVTLPQVTMPQVTMPHVTMPHVRHASHRGRRGALIALVAAALAGAFWMRRRRAQSQSAEYWPHDDHIAGPDAVADGDLPAPDIAPLRSA